jgi:tetratricopeptide (TPR) repeat protein
MSASDTNDRTRRPNRPTKKKRRRQRSRGFWTAPIGGGVIGLSLLLFLVRTVPRAIESARKASRPSAKQSADSAKVRGVSSQQRAQQVDDDLAAAGEAIRLNPKDADAYRTRGSAWLRKGNDTSALADLNEAIQLDPKDMAAYHLRGIAFLHQRDFAKASSDLDEAIRLKPTDANLLADRGRVKNFQKQYDQAIADYTAAIQLDSQNAFAYNGLAWQFATCPVAKYRDGKKAVENASIACKLTEMKQPHFIGTLAAAHAEAGDFTKATRCQWLADSLYAPADKRAWAPMHDLYEAGRPYRDNGQNSPALRFPSLISAIR